MRERERDAGCLDDSIWLVPSTAEVRESCQKQMTTAMRPGIRPHHVLQLTDGVFSELHDGKSPIRTLLSSHF